MSKQDKFKLFERKGQVMNINSINVGLTGENLLSIYNDFVSIKEIDIKKVEINDDIKIIGSFSKGVIIKFEVKVKFNSMEMD